MSIDLTKSELTIDRVVEVVSAALEEDAPRGDITGELLIPQEAQAFAELKARERGIFAGGPVFVAAFKLVDQRVEVKLLIEEGEQFAAGDRLAEINGPARAILQAERIGLNFVQRMCGIATLTKAYVDAVAGTKAKILDTRKTTPLLRAFERHAVLCGGGENHRFSLSHMVMAKDNHLAVLTAGGKDLSAELLRVKQTLPKAIKLEVEVDRLDQIEAVLAGQPDVIMLDNFSLTDLDAAVVQVAGRATTEASGGVNLETVSAIARTGVDLISVGALTHSARAIDLGLDIEIR